MSCCDAYTTLGTITGSDGTEVFYVSFKDRISEYGYSLDATPTITVTSGTVSYVTGSAAIASTATVNGVSHSAGQLLTFKLQSTADDTDRATIEVEAVFDDGTSEKLTKHQCYYVDKGC